MRPGFVIAIGIFVLGSGAAHGVQAETSPTDEAAQTDPAAPPVDPEAMRLYDEGLRHFRAGAYDDAIAALRAAYDKTPLPALLYDLGQAYRLKGDCAHALGAYQHFRATGAMGRQRALTEARIADMQRCSSPSGHDEATPPAPKLSAPAPAMPPVSVLSLSSRPDHDGGAPKVRSRLPAAIASGAAVAFASASGYFAWSASKAADKVSGFFVPGGTWSDDAREADRLGRWSDSMAIATGAAALVSAGVAAWLFWR